MFYCMKETIDCLVSCDSDRPAMKVEVKTKTSASLERLRALQGKD